MDLKELLVKKNITAWDVAEKMGMHPNSFYRRLNGHKSFDTSELFLLSDILDEPLDVVFDAVLNLDKDK